MDAEEFVLGALDAVQGDAHDAAFVPDENPVAEVQIRILEGLQVRFLARVHAPKVVAEGGDLDLPGLAGVLLPRRPELKALRQRSVRDVVEMRALHVEPETNRHIAVGFQEGVAASLLDEGPAFQPLCNPGIVSGSDLPLPRLHPAEQGTSQASPAPLRMDEPPGHVVASSVVVGLPAADTRSNHATVERSNQDVPARVEMRRRAVPVGEVRRSRPGGDAIGFV